MPLFWMDQFAIWSVIILSAMYVANMKRVYLIPFLILALGIIAVAYYLCIVCSWDRSYMFEHATLHGLASLCGHCILAAI